MSKNDSSLVKGKSKIRVRVHICSRALRVHTSWTMHTSCDFQPQPPLPAPEAEEADGQVLKTLHMYTVAPRA